MDTRKARQRITFLLPPEGTDDDGFPRKKWTPYVTVWAELQTLKGKSFYEAASTNLENYRHFRIRYRNDLNDRMRVSWNDIDHELAAPIENTDGMNRYMDVRVKAVTNR
ncbi:phage head closure protein [Halalkalibacterium halodurans]|uniref:phage head closure protein n=1 Tax=Halalkalibacterium halodurans TaxID=86665 RepID=UPI002AAA5982|nr:phage head closure protein [Halalkalibacterium halodurans]MDY7222085.1 phage head closure protein [Halalkalibacterium halodurans]MDY7243896.1 phage head closure protein [Halalkalibacterium halodurans]